MDEWMDEWRVIGCKMDGNRWMDGWVDGLVYAALVGKELGVDGWVDGWADSLVDVRFLSCTYCMPVGGEMSEVWLKVMKNHDLVVQLIGSDGWMDVRLVRWEKGLPGEEVGGRRCWRIPWQEDG